MSAHTETRLVFDKVKTNLGTHFLLETEGETFKN